jgi:hypothetical protein
LMFGLSLYSGGFRKIFRKVILNVC